MSNFLQRIEEDLRPHRFRQQYKISIQQYTQGQYISSSCASILFLNSGTNTLIINNTLQLAPGQSLSIDANREEIDTTSYLISFSGAGVPIATVIIKNYVD